ncbi:MerR family transcriptional regulator [Microlunatus soli]|uniref:DNA-binding transcriptional regulator, MerR family n=1 Tax=Microlunatus soli TaxID=630515 RepID=A0A1H1MYL2_9ACTN|nr:MerR family transcriptional regulator [Microlunatus soli]SDR91971.1 DNA-binding transcriptional regulator, MerR family [Microlunatus soli]
MFSIGEFASINRVTVRLLHHYDRIGLLAPARVDPSSGYRWYAPDQSRQLNRILELRDFGLRLDDVAAIVGGELPASAESDLLAAARSTLARQVEQDTVRLQRLDAFLAAQAGEPTAPVVAASVISVPPVTVGYLTAPAAGWGSVNISPVIGPLFAELAGRLSDAGRTGFGPAIASYRATEREQDGIVVTAAYILDSGEPAAAEGPDPGYKLAVFPALDRVATVTHHGSVATIDQTWHGLLGWVEAHDLHPSGVCREVYHSPPDVPQDGWVTDLQQPVAAD